MTSPFENQMAAVQRAASATPEEIDALRAACRAAGIPDEDSTSAIATYTARGALTAQECSWLAGMSDVTRSVTLSRVFGADAARVAHIAYSQAIG